MHVLHSKHKKNHRSVAKLLIGNRFRLRKRKTSNKDEVIDKIINRLNITEDVLNGAEIISLVGKRNLVIENYVKVVDYEEDRIVVKTKKNYLYVEGSNLKIEYITDEELRISERIDNIYFKFKYIKQEEV